MVSRWNYIAITTVMFIVFVLFQFTNVMLEGMNDYEENPQIRNVDELPGRNDVYSEEKDGAFDESRGRVIYIGDDGKDQGRVVQTWAVYTKQKLLSFDTLAQFEESGWEKEEYPPEMIVIDPEAVDWQRDSEYECLNEFTKAGISLVFGNLPDAETIEGNQRLRELLGISQVREQETTVEGIHLYEGFLLGGEVVYRTEDEEENALRQDMELTFPWYVLSDEAKAYMRGVFGDEDIKAEDSPAIIWRNTAGRAYVFAVNGGYMETAEGLGLLSAMRSQMGDYQLYPVVNAQNLVIAGYPGLAEENWYGMETQYGRTMEELFRNTVWPAVIAVYRQNTLGLSCMMAMQFDYADEELPSQDQLLYYMRRLNEERAEAGLYGLSVSNTSLEQKLTEDGWFMDGTLPSYRFTSFYTGGLPDAEINEALGDELLADVRTVVADYDGSSEIIGYQTDNITRQCTVTDGVRHTYREDFLVKCLETALGYTSVRVDMSRVAFPEQDEDALTELTSSLGWNIRSYFRGFGGFDGTTVSESDGRIRNFLALDHTQHRENNAVYLEVDGADESSWFILRSENETVSRVEGGSFRQLEKNAYLIEVQEKNAVITLKPGRRR